MLPGEENCRHGGSYRKKNGSAVNKGLALSGRTPHDIEKATLSSAIETMTLILMLTLTSKIEPSRRQ